MRFDPDWRPEHPLWVFIDESGNFDFSESGTRHFLMTAVITTDAAATAASMLALKYEQMLRGSNQLDFHATHNSRGTRKRVFERISRMREIRSRTFIVDKRALSPAQSNIEGLIEMLAPTITTWALDTASLACDHLSLVFDTAFTKTQCELIQHHAKAILGRANVRYRIVFHRVANEPNGQIADFIAWSHFRAIEHGSLEGLAELSQSAHASQWLNK